MVWLYTSKDMVLFSLEGQVVFVYKKGFIVAGY